MRDVLNRARRAGDWCCVRSGYVRTFVRIGSHDEGECGYQMVLSGSEGGLRAAVVGV